MVLVSALRADIKDIRRLLCYTDDILELFFWGPVAVTYLTFFKLKLYLSVGHTYYSGIVKVFRRYGISRTDIGTRTTTNTCF